ncbi:MAG: hypothetical protein AAB400_00070 [Patescibacteria group bacterium]
MNIRIHGLLFTLLCISFLGSVAIGHAYAKQQDMHGRILLQVQERGEAWYVKPTDGKRVYMGRPDDAFRIMRQLGIGISNNDLQRIPIAPVPFLFSRSDDDLDELSPELEKSFGTDPAKADTDGDGHSDKEEMENGYDPLGPGKLSLDTRFAAKKKGIIFLQVESAGEAWYVNPADGTRHYLGRPYDAWNIMKTTGLGISNSDLYKIKESIIDHPIAFDPATLDAGERIGTTQVRSVEKHAYQAPRDPDYTIHLVGELTLTGSILTDERCIHEIDQSSRERVPYASQAGFDGLICFTNTAQFDRVVEAQSIKGTRMQPMSAMIVVDNLTLTTDNRDNATYTAEFLEFKGPAKQVLQEETIPRR